MVFASSDPSLVAALVRVVIVFGLLFAVLRVIGRVTGRTPRGRSKVGRGHRGGRVVEILDRQSVGREATIAVVRIDGRRLAIGITEHQVQVLTELEPDEPAGVEAEVIELDRTGVRSEPAATGPFGVRVGRALAGGGATPANWRTVVDGLRERTVRRSASGA
jgi:flagellar protein FliO/FliZ